MSEQTSEGQPDYPQIVSHIEELARRVRRRNTSTRRPGRKRPISSETWPSR